MNAKFFFFLFVLFCFITETGIAKQRNIAINYDQVNCQADLNSTDNAQLEYMTLDLLVCSIQDMTDVVLDRQNIQGGAKAVLGGLVEAGIDEKVAQTLVAKAIDSIFPPEVIEPAIGPYEPEIALAKLPMINENQRAAPITVVDTPAIFIPQNDPSASPQ